MKKSWNGNRIKSSQFFGPCSAPMHFAPRVRNVIDFVKLKISEKTNRLSIETRTWNSIIGFQLKKKMVGWVRLSNHSAKSNKQIVIFQKWKLCSIFFTLDHFVPSIHAHCTRTFFFPEGWIEIEIEFERIFKRKRNLIKWI